MQESTTLYSLDILLTHLNILRNVKEFVGGLASSHKHFQSVQEMGTFDGWSQGEYLSPEYDVSFTEFAPT